MVTPKTPSGPARPPWVDGPPAAGVSALVTTALTATVVAALYFGRTVFVPLALAMLLSFALAPLVRRLRRLGLPRLPSVLAVVTLRLSASSSPSAGS